VRFFTPNLLTRHRAKCMLLKEPETIAWIEGFAAVGLLLDIGEGVGTYTMLAAARAHRVLTVEPEAGNYCLLHRNIALNGFDGIVEAHGVGLGASEGLFKPHLSTAQLGNSMRHVVRHVILRDLRSIRHPVRVQLGRRWVLSCTLSARF